MRYRTARPAGLIFIWVRRTLDWDRSPSDLEQAIDPRMRDKVRLFNSTFTMPYGSFRSRIAKIALLSHSRVEGAVRESWDQIPDGALVLPVDDDDWFAPHAARVLEPELHPGIEGCLWQSRWIERPTSSRHGLWLIRRRLFPGTPQKWICTTNNYALVKRPDTRELLYSHMLASRWFEARLARGAADVRRLDARISVANRHLASQTTLRIDGPTISRATLIRKFRSYRRLYDRQVPEELAWCRPYVAMMRELMAELKLIER